MVTASMASLISYQFIERVLRFGYLARHSEGALARDIEEAAAEALELTSHERGQLLPICGQAVFKNRAGWAHDRLKRCGLWSGVECMSMNSLEWAKVGERNSNELTTL